MTKFCSLFHDILAFKQNRAPTQEIGYGDLILQYFFILVILKNKGATNALYKILAFSKIYLMVQEEKLILVV